MAPEQKVILPPSRNKSFFYNHLWIQLFVLSSTISNFDYIVKMGEKGLDLVPFIVKSSWNRLFFFKSEF